MDIQLLVNGTRYGGWTGISLSRSVETVAGSFTLECTENVGGEAVKWPLRPNMPVKVLVADQILIDGFIDKVSIDVDAGSHSISVAGRDKTGDLVDCVAEQTPAQWRNITVFELCKILCRPFGIEVVNETAEAKPLAVFKLEPSETVFAAIDRACKLRGLLPIQARGALVLTNIGKGKAVTPLIYGGNIKSGTAEVDFSERFSSYSVSGQRAGSDGDNGKAVAHVKEKVSDDGIARYRPFAKQADGQADAATAKRQAQWEKQVREARSQTLALTVAGWTQQDGSVWDINQLVQIQADLLGVNGEMLIAALEYSFDDSGEITKLSLKHPDAYLADPEDEKPKEQSKAADKSAKPKSDTSKHKTPAAQTRKKGGKAAKHGGGESLGAAWELKPDSKGEYKPEIPKKAGKS